MRAPVRLPVVALFLLSAATSARAQILRGRVIDNASGEGVATATVEALAAGRSAGRARTAVDGKFEVRLRAPGTFQLLAQRTGYSASTTSDVPVAVRETVYVEIRVAAAPMQLDPLRVTARVAPPRRRTLERTGFYDRERMGIGRFFRREDFERYQHLSTSRVLSRAPGVIVQGAGPREYVVFTRSSISGALVRSGAGYCMPLLYLDGVRISSASALNEVAGAANVEAVELYQSAAEIPVEYVGSGSACGVILVWTRHEP
ncbi:MAG TPA: carboxypeptidase regulatory-like domain-containing protein [Longimicrobiaceae bacterium]|nr:carboxypeptidase regulatory-like domain-containing protein [Longimicrobiaceae bacterium]